MKCIDLFIYHPELTEKIATGIISYCRSDFTNQFNISKLSLTCRFSGYFLESINEFNTSYFYTSVTPLSIFNKEDSPSYIITEILRRELKKEDEGKEYILSIQMDFPSILQIIQARREVNRWGIIWKQESLEKD